MADPTGVIVLKAFSSLADIAQTLKSMTASAEVKARVTELYDVILTGQRTALQSSIEQQAMLDTIRTLEEKLRQKETWETTQKRYQLHEIEPGMFAYGVKSDSKNGEIAHWACANCYQQGHISILQLTHDEYRTQVYSCPRCKTQLVLRYEDSVSKPKFL